MRYCVVQAFSLKVCGLRRSAAFGDISRSRSLYTEIGTDAPGSAPPGEDDITV